MKANELRIGNLLLGSIYFDEEEARQDLGQDYSEQEEWKITEVEGIPHQFENCTAWTDEEYNRLKPIPLTEEWLVRFGFKLSSDRIHSNNYTEYYLNKIYFATHKKLDHWFLLGKETKLKYVHQLQNLYFALTGEELELK